MRRTVAISWLLLLLALIGSTGSFAATYYVAKTGDDTNEGSLASPWLTIGKATSTMVAGDTTFVHSGTYSESVSFPVSGSSGNEIVLKNYPGEQPVIDGGYGTQTIDIPDKDYIVVDGFEIKKATNYVIKLKGEHNIIRNCIVHDATGGTGTGILLIDRLGTKYNIIEDNRVYDTYWNVISVEGSYNTIRRNTIYGSDDHFGINLRPNEVGTHSYSNIVQYNLIYACDNGIYVSRQESTDVIANLIYENNDEAGAGKGILVDANSLHTDIYNNTIVENTGWGLYAEGGSSSSTLRNNIFAFNGQWDISFASPSGDVLDYNLYYRTTGDVISWAGTGYTLSGFQGASGQENHGLESDPLFENRVGNNYRLQNDSPAIDAGTPLGLPYSGSAPDIGFYEMWGISLYKGINFISYPVDSDTAFTSYTLLSHTPTCTKLARWRKDLQSYDEVQDGVGTNFTINLAEGYRFNVTADTPVCFTGYRIGVPTPISLKAGLNLISVPDTTKSFTSYSLIGSIDNCTEVTQWKAKLQSYESAAVVGVDTVGSNFPIDVGQGYFLKVTSDTEWSGE